MDFTVILLVAMFLVFIYLSNNNNDKGGYS